MQIPNETPGSPTFVGSPTVEQSTLSAKSPDGRGMGNRTSGDSGIGQTFFPPDFRLNTVASTPKTPNMLAELDEPRGLNGKVKWKYWCVFLLCWSAFLSVSAVTYMIYHYLDDIHSMCIEYIHAYGTQIVVIASALGTFIMSTIVFMCWLSNESRSFENKDSLISPIDSGRTTSRNDIGPKYNKNAVELDTVADKIVQESDRRGRNLPCRRTFSGQGNDVWHDFKRYFENICQLNDWTIELSRHTFLCCLRGQAEAYAYGLPLDIQNDFSRLFVRMESRFGTENMKNSLIADSKLRKKRKEDSYREFGQAIEDLYRMAYPENPELVQENALMTFLENCNEGSNFRMSVKRTFPKNIQEAVTSAMQEECLRLTERDTRSKELNLHSVGGSNDTNSVYDNQKKSYPRSQRRGRRSRDQRFTSQPLN